MHRTKLMVLSTFFWSHVWGMAITSSKPDVLKLVAVVKKNHFKELTKAYPTILFHYKNNWDASYAQYTALIPLDVMRKFKEDKRVENLIDPLGIIPNAKDENA